MEEILHQLIGSLSHYRVLYIPGGAAFLPSTVMHYVGCWKQILAINFPVATACRPTHVFVWLFGVKVVVGQQNCTLLMGFWNRKQQNCETQVFLRDGQVTFSKLSDRQNRGQKGRLESPGHCHSAGVWALFSGISWSVGEHSSPTKRGCKMRFLLRKRPPRKGNPSFWGSNYWRCISYFKKWWIFQPALLVDPHFLFSNLPGIWWLPCSLPCHHYCWVASKRSDSEIERSCRRGESSASYPKYWMQPISPPKQRTNTTAFQAIVSWLRCRHRMNRWRGKFLRMWLSWFFKLDLVQESSVLEEYIIISCQIMAIVWVSIS